MKDAEELHDLNVTKDKLFSVIAHDLRNPIGSIMNLVDVVNEQQASLSPAEIAKMLSAIQKSATNTFGLLENLLDWSRIQRGIINPNSKAKL